MREGPSPKFHPVQPRVAGLALFTLFSLFTACTAPAAPPLTPDARIHELELELARARSRVCVESPREEPRAEYWRELRPFEEGR